MLAEHYFNYKINHYMLPCFQIELVRKKKSTQVSTQVLVAT